jgi:hypothetical protein
MKITMYRENRVEKCDGGEMEGWRVDAIKYCCRRPDSLSTRDDRLYRFRLLVKREWI